MSARFQIAVPDSGGSGPEVVAEGVNVLRTVAPRRAGVTGEFAPQAVGAVE